MALETILHAKSVSSAAATSSFYSDFHVWQRQRKADVISCFYILDNFDVKFESNNPQKEQIFESGP